MKMKGTLATTVKKKLIKKLCLDEARPFVDFMMTLFSKDVFSVSCH